MCCTLQRRKPAGQAVSRPLPCFDVVMLIKKRSFSANSKKNTEKKIYRAILVFGKKINSKGARVCVRMFCISSINHGSQCREDRNCKFLLMFSCFVRLLDKHVGSEEMRVMLTNKEWDGGTENIRESFLDLTQTTGSDRTVTSAEALLRMEGSREKQGEAGDDALREAGMRKVLSRERGEKKRERQQQ